MPQERHAEAAHYIERLFPQLRKQYVKHADDEDICQYVLFDLLKKWEQLNITSDEQFTNMFARFFYTSKWVERAHRARSLSRGSYWLRHAGGIPLAYYEHAGNQSSRWGTLLEEPRITNPHGVTTEYDPWNSNRVDALEWIEQLPTPLYRKIFTHYYIEGYTQSEIGAMIGSYRERVNLILQEGVILLQQARLVQLTEEGRNVSGAPTHTGGTHEANV